MSKTFVKIIICIGIIAGLLCSADMLYAGEGLSLGVHPYRPMPKLMKMFSPLADYLAVKTGMSVEILVAKDYQEHIEKAGHDELDIAYVGPASYVKLVNNYGKKTLLACLEINGKSNFQGVIVARRDSSINNLSDLKGKKFAFGDPASTMSHLVPRITLWNAGIIVEDFFNYSFVGNHSNVALGVLTGDFDAGAVKEEAFHDYRERGLRALAFTETVSEHLFLVSNKVSPEVREILKKALLDLKNSPEGKKIMQSIKSDMTAMVPVMDSDYDNLREIEKKLKTMGVAF